MWRTYLATGLGVVFLCSIPPWLQLARGMKRAYEMAAIRSVVTLNTAQTVYRSEYGRFAQSLNELGPPADPLEQPTEKSADLIARNLATGTASGYYFLMLPCEDSYQALAFPQTEKFGERSFYSDETTVIRAHKGRPAWANDQAIR